MAPRKDTNTRIVYSTEHGRMCPECGKPAVQCVCRKTKPAIKSDGIVRVGRETKGRRGKSVTTITGVPLGDLELKTLAKDLKSKCGAGGAIKNGVIEIQGDHRDMLIEELQKYKWQIKRSGG